MKTNLCYNPSLVTQYLSGYSKQLWSINTPFPCVAVPEGRHFQHCLWLTLSCGTVCVHKPNRDIRTNRGLWWVWEWGGCHPLHKHERTGPIYAIAQGKATITTSQQKKVMALILFMLDWVQPSVPRWRTLSSPIVIAPLFFLLPVIHNELSDSIKLKCPLGCKLLVNNSVTKLWL